VSDDRHDPRPTDSEIGDALRSSDEELSPGFYTRARARFKESRAPSSRRRFRFGSWELAGVVATIALAGVLFVPYLMRQELEPAVLSARQVADELAPVVSDVAANVATEPAAVEESVVRRRDAPEEKRKATREMTTVGFAQDEAGASAPAAARPEALSKKDSGKRESDADAFGMAERESLEDAVETLIVPLATSQIVVLLPQATLPPAVVELYEITDPEPWSVMMEGAAGIALAPLGPVRPFVRLVLILAPTPVDCSNSRIVSSGERIDIALAPGLLEGTTGCAAVLAADSRPIEARIVGDE